MLLARHGRTALNAEGRLRGLADPPLDSIGEAEAFALGQSLSRFRPRVIRCSASFDSTGSYAPVLPWLAGTLAAAALILMLGRYRYPAIHGYDEIVAQDEFAATTLFTDDLAADADSGQTTAEPSRTSSSS